MNVTLLERLMRNPRWLGVILGIQGLALIFLVTDMVQEFGENPFGLAGITEAVTGCALISGMVLGGVILRGTMARLARQDMALAKAKGALADVIAAQFAAWHLTPAEYDVGFFALKGLDVAEIAALRGAANGTVRAQLTSIYAKAGVSGRAQFAAFFVEDLLSGSLTDAGPTG